MLASDPPVRARTRPAAAVLAAVAVTVLSWASAFLVIRDVRGAFAPGALALGRLLVGSLVLSVAVVLRGRWVAPSRREWGLVALCGIAWFGIYNVALNAAERRLDAGTAAMLVNVGPILIALLAGTVLREGLPRWLLVGAGVAFAAAVLIGIATSGRHSSDVLGVVLCLVAALAYAIGVTAQKPALRRLPALQLTQMACVIGALTCLPFAGQLGGDLGRASGGSVLGVVYLGAIPTALAFGTWAFALARVRAGRLGVSTYLVPPLTILGSWPLLGETPPALALVGGLLALVGVAITRRSPPPG